MTIIRITDEDTRETIAEALTNLAHHAKRQQCLIGTDDQPSPWTKDHRAIDVLLQYWELAPPAVVEVPC